MSSTTAPDPDFAWLDAELAALRDLDAQAIKKGTALDKGNALLKALRSRCDFPSMNSDEEIPLADFDENSILPRAENLTPLQRRMVVGLMDLERIHEEPLSPHGSAWRALPMGRDALSRWLGLAPAGALETLVPFSLIGPARKEPLWRALLIFLSVRQRCGLPKTTKQAFFEELPLVLRVRAADETAFHGSLATYGLEPENLNLLHGDFERIDTSYLPWASEAATRWSAKLAASKKRKAVDRIWAAPDEVAIPIFAALLASGEPIAPEWDGLVPSLGGSLLVQSEELASWGERALAALPPERRLVQALRLFEAPIPSEYKVDLSLRVFRGLPEPALFKLLKRELTHSLPLADAAEKKRIKAGLLELEKVAASRSAKPARKGESPPKKTNGPLALVLRSCIEVTAKTPLTPTQTKQILKAGEAYFEGKRSLKRLLSEEAEEGDSFHGNLELRTLATEDGKTAYDLVYAMGDSGLVFASGKSKPIAQIVQYGIEDCDDDDLAAVLAKGLKLEPPKAAKEASGKRSAQANRSK